MRDGHVFETRCRWHAVGVAGGDDGTVGLDLGVGERGKRERPVWARWSSLLEGKTVVGWCGGKKRGAGRQRADCKEDRKSVV